MKTRKLSLFIVSSFGLISMSQAQDTTPPQLGSIAVVPGNVDVSTANQVVTVTLNITDDESGLGFGNIFLWGPTNNFVKSKFFNDSQRTSGDGLDGDYDVTASVPQYGPPGTWKVGVLLFDDAGNRKEYGPFDDPYPMPGDEEIAVLNSGTIDSTSPQLASIGVSPSSIDTGYLAQDVTFTLNITDNLSGFRSASVGVVDPTNSVQFNSTVFVPASSATSGGPLNGTYEVTVSVPQGSVDGTWGAYVFVRDEAGNTTTYNDPPGGEFTVTNASGSPQGDLSDAVDATQYSWSTSGDNDWFIQSTTTCDGIDAAQSGITFDDGNSDMTTTVTGPGTLSFYWKCDSEEGADYLSVDIPSTGDFEEISGDVDWEEQTFSLPPGSHVITWSYYKNSSAFSGEDAGWVDKVKFLGSSDNEPPVLQRISISPTPVDVSGGDVDVTVTIEITDDFNGVDSGYVDFYDPFDENYNGAPFDSFDLISGDSNCGVYEVVISISQSDFDPGSPFEFGTWRAEVTIDEDGGGNSATYGGSGGQAFPIPGAEMFTVTDSPGGMDVSGPTLDGINNITPNPANVSSGPDNVTINFDVSDNSSGFAFGSVLLYNANGNFVRSTFFDTNNEVSSTGPLSGTYEVVVPVPEYGPPGTWEVNFSLTDSDNNNRDYPFNSPFPNPGDENFSVTNTGMIDSSVPVLHGITITPGNIDTSLAPQTIDVTLDVTDDLSGLRFAFIFLYDPNDNFINSPIGVIDGSAMTSGPFVESIEIPQGSMEGTWEVSVFLRDMVGNFVEYGLTGTATFPVQSDAEFVVGPVGGGSTFGNFSSNFSLTGPDALPWANPDNDSFNNALELLLGLNPNVPNLPNPALYSSSVSGGSLHLDFTIDSTLMVQTSGDHLEVSDATGSPFLVTGQTGVNLKNDWTNQLPASTGGSSYRVSLPLSSGDSGRIRLEITDP